MDPINELHNQTWPVVLQRAQALAETFLAGLDLRPVASAVTAPVFETVSAKGLGAEGALASFWQQWSPTLSASAGPRYFGFVTGGSTPAALAADWLVSSVDQNAQMGGGSQAAALEAHTVRQFCQALALPDSFTGGFVSGATMANLCGLVIGRQHLGAQRGIDVSEVGGQHLPLTVLSGGIHSSAIKACSVVGIGRTAVQTVALQPDREAVDLNALEHALQQQRNSAVIVVANAGTVNTVDFDDLQALVALKDRYGFWLHVDAAFGGVAAFSERYRALLTGWEYADSITIDAHKWLNVPYDSALILTRHLSSQLAVFQNRSRYLSAPECVPENFLHLLPENSRRWRALPVYLSLLAYGREGIAAMVERHVELTQQLAQGIAAIDGLRLLAPARLNGVCFALRDNGADASRQRVEFLSRLYAEGVCYFTPTQYQNRAAIRGALVNWRTTAQDIELTLQSLARCVSE